MMSITYKVAEENLYTEDGSVRKAYGIGVMEDGRLSRMVSDLFCERAPAEAFAALCSRLNLDPIQLDDVIADMLAAK